MKRSRFLSGVRRVIYFLRTGYWHSGERVNPDFRDPNFENHFRVYKFLGQVSIGKRVLDVGCGTGYGTAYLAQVSQETIGIDISRMAINHARKKYPTARFLQMDAHHLDFPAESFDLIVSTENLEHLRDQDTHLRELARVIKGGGSCFIATPNPEMFVGIHNRYHIKENTFDELSLLLRRNFDDVVILENQLVPPTLEGQRSREERFAREHRGVTPDGQLKAFDTILDTSYLSNTHSFFCFCRKPKQREHQDQSGRQNVVEDSATTQFPSTGSRIPNAPLDGARLAKNTAFNFAGQVLPLFAGVLLIPYIARGLGLDRFGMLGIIWVVFGYFSLMDFGLGRATTKFLAEWLVREEEDRISEMVWSSILLQILLGAAGGILLAALTPILVERVLKTPASLVGEARAAFFVLAAALPIIMAASGLRSVLEGCQRFDIANLLRIPSNILTFVIPGVAVAVGLRLPGIVLWMGIFRAVFTFAHGYCCLRVLPCLRAQPTFRSGVLWPLLSFGGWVTVANLVNPILVSMDRFLIGSLISVKAVGYYTAPFEAVTRLWMIPASLMSTVYPACSVLGMERINELQALYSRSIRYVFCTIAPLSLVLVVFARPIIGAWLGPGFVEKSAVPLQFLAVGVFINCFAHIPYCFLQALGRPDTTAMLFLLELLPYGLFAWWMIERYGIPGAAAAWSIRVAIEVFLLLWIARRVLSLSASCRADRRMWAGLAALCAVAVGIHATHTLLRVNILEDAGVCAVWLLAFALAAWRWVLDGADRASALAVLGPLRNVFRKSLESPQME